MDRPPLRNYTIYAWLSYKDGELAASRSLRDATNCYACQRKVDVRKGTLRPPEPPIPVRATCMHHPTIRFCWTIALTALLLHARLVIPKLTDLAILELASQPSLERLAAAGLPNLTEQAAFFLAEHAFELEQLHLSYCPRLTLDGIRVILRRLTKLVNVGLSGVPAMRRMGVRRYSAKPPEVSRVRPHDQQQALKACLHSRRGTTKPSRACIVYSRGQTFGSCLNSWRKKSGENERQSG